MILVSFVIAQNTLTVYFKHCNSQPLHHDWQVWKNYAVKPEISFSLITHSSFLKPGAYITHNAIRHFQFGQKFRCVMLAVLMQPVVQLLSNLTPSDFLYFQTQCVPAKLMFIQVTSHDQKWHYNPSLCSSLLSHIRLSTTFKDLKTD